MTGTMSKLPKPIGENILVRVEKGDGKEVINGIVVPENPYRSRRGVIVAIGTGKLLESGIRIPFDVKVGQTVLLVSFGERMRIDGDDYMLVNETMIYGIFTPEGE